LLQYGLIEESLSFGELIFGNKPIAMIDIVKGYNGMRRAKGNGNGGCVGVIRFAI
jgi:hypothetical protein